MEDDGGIESGDSMGCGIGWEVVWHGTEVGQGDGTAS